MHNSRYLKYKFILLAALMLCCLIPRSGSCKIRVPAERATKHPDTITLQGHNPALRIIKQVMAHRMENDPREMSSFSYTSYDEFLVSQGPVSIPENDSMMPDTALAGIKKSMDARHFFLMETMSEHSYSRPGKTYMKVNASRISGSQDPLYGLLFSQFQSISFYDTVITILDKNYLNPMSKRGIATYLFRIQDTLLHKPEADTTYIISFHPLHTDFDGLIGILSVSPDNWALLNVVAEPVRQNDVMQIRMTQSYTRVEGHRWFPYRFTADFTLNDIAVASGKPIKLTGISKRILSHIVLDPVLVRRIIIKTGSKPDTGMVIQKGSDSLDNRLYMNGNDTIGKADETGKQDKTNEAIISGHPLMGVFELDMNRFFHYNRYQGLYLGFGAHTGEKLSRFFSAGGYWGYGFGSKSAVFGVDGILVMDRRSQTKLKLELSRDFWESGGLPDYGEVKRLLDPSGFYKFMVRRMDRTDLRQVTVSSGMVKYLRAGISVFQSVETPAYEYAYVISQDKNVAVLSNQFHFSGFSFNLRYAYSEKPKPLADMSSGANYPVVRMKFTRGIAGWLGGEYGFERYDLNIQESFQTKGLGRTSVTLQAGIVSADVPYSHLFDGRGSYGKFTIYAPQSFATMRQNEFVSNRFASLFFVQDFGKLLPHSGNFKPVLAWCAAAGIGDLAHPEKHRYINIRTLSRGYFESGILINNLLDLKVYNLGIGAFYRLGAYAFPTFGDNIALKFSVNVPL